MHHPRLMRAALGCAAAALLGFAPAAMAGTIRYDVAESASYTIDNEQGIVKVTYNGCVVAGERQTINFAMVTNASADATVERPSGETVPVPTSGVLGAVNSGFAKGAAECIATPRSVRLRAGERTRLDVVIAMNGQRIQNALVRVTLPGGRALRIRTGLNGVSRFTLRPRRSGRAVIQSDVCFGARRVTVLAARVQAQQAPARFTG